MFDWETVNQSKAVTELYESSSQPVAVVDNQLKVIWTNSAATDKFSDLRLPDGMRSILTLEEMEAITTKLKNGEAIHVDSGHLPLSTTSMLFTPISADCSLAFISPQDDPGSVYDPKGATRVVASFSGQMRAPLSMIFSSLFTLSRLPEIKGAKDINEQLGNISRNSYLLLRHCFNTTEYIKFLSGINQVETKTMNICSFVNELGRAMASLTNEIGIPLNVSVPSKPIICEFDQNKLQNAILNIISNSCRYTRVENFITITLEESGNKGVKISIVDRGTGMSPEILPDIFEPFYAAQQGKTAPGGGLGLPVAKLSISAMGGSMVVQSTQAHGTTVVINLPTVPPASANSLLKSPRMMDYVTDRFSHLYILLSDSCKTPED